MTSSTAFYPLKVRNVEKITPDCVVISFDVDDQLKTLFQFSPGQYITIRHQYNHEELRRSYSICSDPDTLPLSVAVKQVENGRFSSFANQDLRAGDILEVMPPMGQFLLKPRIKPYLVFFAAGSGITPIISHIRYILNHDTEAKAVLFYGNKNFESIIFREELEGLKNKFIDRLAIYYVFSKEKLGSPAFFGRINSEKCQIFSRYFFQPDQTDQFLICGPSDMIFQVKETLNSMGIPENCIRFELFSTDGIPKKSDKETIAQTEGMSSSITIKLDGDLFEFPLQYNGESILDTALKNGADLPYACKGGVCSTCKARILEGEVDMDINYALEPDELAAGYVLTCQAHPRTPKVVVDFDQK